MNNNASIASIDIFKFIFSLFVVSIHTNVASYIVDPILRDVWILLCNSAVPFFFAVSGYFMYETVRQKDIPQLNKQIKKISLLYVIWSLLYLPINIYGEVVKYEHVDTWYINIIKGWIFTGDNYGSWILWYLHAFMISLILIRIFMNKVHIKYIVLISLILYAVGGAYSLYHDSFQIYLYDHTFRTTRNGLFTGLACVCAGFIVARYKIPNIFMLIVLLVSQFWVCKYIRVLLCGYIFLSISVCFPINSNGTILLRKCSGWIYFTHMFFVFIYKDLFCYEYGVQLFLMTAFSSMLLSLTIVLCSSRFKVMGFLKYLA